VYVLGGRGPERTKRNDVWRLDTAQVNLFRTLSS
jgi:hypothetical protein